jgi:transposase
MKITHIVGIDVSKLTLDYHHYTGLGENQSVTNDNKGHKALLRWLKSNVTKEVKDIMVVMEHTGYYTYKLEQFLFKNQVSYCKKPALDIKRSCGMIRGKSDKADAKMISKYGWMRKDELKPSQPVSDSYLELQQLMAHRDKLVADKASYQSRLKELKLQLADKLATQVIKSSQHLLNILSVEIKETEASIEALLQKNEALNNNYLLVKSVKGIGFATAIHFLIATENFSCFDNHRKFACYCGVAPFENSSGTSVRGKTKTSSLANRKIKSLLTMAAICAIQHDPELKEKYQQKVKEGKAKMCALNIIRAKLIERIFAVIKRQSPYILKIAA